MDPSKSQPTQTPPDKPLGPYIEMIGAADISDVGTHGGVVRVKTEDHVNKAKTTYGKVLLEQCSPEEMFWLVYTSLQMWAMRVGAFFGLPLLKQPAGAKTKLVPAIDGLVRCAHLLYAEAPAVLSGIDLDSVVAIRKRLVNLRAIMARVADFHDSLEALESHLETSLDGTARLIHQRSQSLMKTHRSIGRELEALDDLVTGPAQDAVDTRRVLGKARQEARDELLKEQADKASTDKPKVAPPGDKGAP